VEAAVTAALEHPGIAPVYGMGLHPDGRPFYAMRLIKGYHLSDDINRFHADDELAKGPVRRSWRMRALLDCFVHVCNAIDYAHSRGVLHRNIRPSAILHGVHGVTVVVSWGVAKVFNQNVAGSISTSGEQYEVPGRILGTPSYMSPEQAAGMCQELGPATDVYGLGATLYCILTGRAPFEGSDVQSTLHLVQMGQFQPPRQLKRKVPPELEAVCLKAMSLDPADRYISVSALAEDIRMWLVDKPVSAYREGLASRIRRRVRHHRTWVCAVLGFILGTLVTFFALVFRRAF
jgi:serine/threonine protein kinase